MKSFTENIYGHKKKVCLEQNISMGSIHASFHNFHVSIYAKWPQKLVMHSGIINIQVWLTFRRKLECTYSGVNIKRQLPFCNSYSSRYFYNLTSTMNKKTKFWSFRQKSYSSHNMCIRISFEELPVPHFLIPKMIARGNLWALNVDFISYAWNLPYLDSCCVLSAMNK